MSWRLATLCFVAFPLAVSGGVLMAALADGGTLTFGSWIALYAVFGLAARNAMLLIERIRQLELQGVAKLDSKHGPDGSLHLFEVNPRFNLWHHPGALAGVNLPEIVYSDLVGLPRPLARTARPGVRWCSLAHDLQAARADGTGPARWVAWALRCEAKSGFAWDDPLPLPRAALWRLRRWTRTGTS